MNFTSSIAATFSPAAARDCACCNLSASANSTASSSSSGLSNFAIGLVLALASCLFNGASYVVSKMGLERYLKHSGRSGGYAGLGYMREWLWWIGLVLLAVGQLGNFLALSFAPASLVMPLQGLSAVWSVILARFLLKERVNLYAQIGILLSLLGAVNIVLQAPQETTFSTLNQLQDAVLTADGLAVAAVLAAFVVFAAAYLGPRWGDRNPFIFLGLASAAAPFTVFGCKAAGLAVGDTIAGRSQLGDWFTWVMLVVMLCGILLQIYYTNRSLALFNASLVTPVYFVILTSFVLVVSGIVSREFSALAAADVVVMVCGFLVIAIGVIMISVFSAEEYSWSNMRRALMQQSVRPPVLHPDSLSLPSNSSLRRRAKVQAFECETDSSDNKSDLPVSKLAFDNAAAQLDDRPSAEAIVSIDHDPPQSSANNTIKVSFASEANVHRTNSSSQVSEAVAYAEAEPANETETQSDFTIDRVEHCDDSGTHS